MTASTAEADLHRARQMVARAHAGEHVAGVERLGDGLANAVYRVTAFGSRESLAVRVLTNHHESMAKETAVLDALNGRNVLVAAVNDRWQVAALLDWEHAFLGGALWDVGVPQMSGPDREAGQRGGKRRLRPLT